MVTEASTETGNGNSGARKKAGKPAVIGRKMLIVMLILLLSLVLLPEVIRYAAIKAIPAQGLGDAEIDDIDLNLFAGTVGIDQFSLGRDGSSKLELGRLILDFSWLKLLLGEFHIQQVTIEDVRFDVLQAADGSWEVVLPVAAGDPVATEPVDQPALQLPKVLLRQLSLKNVEVTVQSDMVAGRLLIEQLNLHRASTWLQQQVELELAASWNDAPVTLSLNANPWQQSPAVDGILRLDGVSLTGISVPAVDSLSGQVDIELAFDVRQTNDDELQSALQVDLQVNDLAAEYQQVNAASEKLAWRGDAQFSVDADQALAYSIRGGLQATGLELADKQQQVSLLNWQDFTIENFSIDQALNLSMDSARFVTIAMFDHDRDHAQGQGARLRTAAIDIASLKLEAGQALAIESVQVKDGQYQLAIDPQGQLYIQQVLSNLMARLAPAGQDTAASVDTAGTDVAGDKPFTLALGQFGLVGDSSLLFTDQRFTVPVKQQLHIEQLSLAGLDQASPRSPAEFKFLGRIGEFSAIDISAELKPFAKQLEVSARGKLDAIDLPGISPYSEAYLGYHLTRGQFDQSFDVEIADETIKLKNKLVLRQLALKSVDPDKIQPMEKQLDVPLALALDMLRDGDDNIELDVPIEGRLDDPSVNINDIISDALGNALKSGAAGFLTLALQPYGAVLMAADMVGEQLSKVRLEPVVFAPGQGELVAQHLDYTAKIAALLTQRPKLQLTLCGLSNQQDKALLLPARQAENSKGEPGTQPTASSTAEPSGPAVEARLLALAGQRGEAVKRQLIVQGIESRRLFLCQPQYQADAASAVTMAM